MFKMLQKLLTDQYDQEEKRYKDDAALREDVRRRLTFLEQQIELLRDSSTYGKNSK